MYTKGIHLQTFLYRPHPEGHCGVLVDITTQLLFMVAVPGHMAVIHSQSSVSSLDHPVQVGAPQDDYKETE